MFKKVLLALAVAGMLTSAANAATTLTYTLTAESVSGLNGADGTWKLYAQITQGTASDTGGIALLGCDLVTTGNATIVDFTDPDGVLGSNLDLPSGTAFAVTGAGTQTPGFTGFGNSPGVAGVGIAGSQPVTAYYRNSGSTLWNVLDGVGLGGKTEYGATWGSPVLVADGYWLGTGTIGVAITDPNANLLLVPKSLWPTTTSNLSTAGGASVDTMFPDTISLSNPVVVGSAPVDTPEPASLGVLALGGLALLARRRKAC